MTFSNSLQGVLYFVLSNLTLWKPLCIFCLRRRPTFSPLIRSTTQHRHYYTYSFIFLVIILTPAVVSELTDFELARRRYFFTSFLLHDDVVESPTSHATVYPVEHFLYHRRMVPFGSTTTTTTTTTSPCWYLSCWKLIGIVALSASLLPGRDAFAVGPSLNTAAASSSCYGRRMTDIAPRLLPPSSLSATAKHGIELSSSREQQQNAAELSSNTKEQEEIPGSSSPLFSVGVIADIQYAPIPDGFSYSGIPRYYRHSLEVTRFAAAHFEQEKVDLVLNLGDTVDGKCQDIEGNGGDPVPVGVDPGHMSVDEVLDALSGYTHGPIIHTYGNHCLYNLDRETLGEKLGVKFIQEPCGDLVGYHQHVHHNIRFVVLDSYDVAIMKRCEHTSEKRKQAHALLEKNNPNFPDNENSPEGLEGNDKRYVAFNGGVGPRQLIWLRETLLEAREQDEKVILLSHQPILPGSTSPVCLVWNYEEVLDILREFHDVVVASFSGHAHKGGYKRDEESGIHFRVFEAALENYPEKTYAMVDVFENRLVVRGFGNCLSATYDFDHLSGTVPAAVVGDTGTSSL